MSFFTFDEVQGPSRDARRHHHERGRTRVSNASVARYPVSFRHTPAFSRKILGTLSCHRLHRPISRRFTGNGSARTPAPRVTRRKGDKVGARGSPRKRNDGRRWSTNVIGVICVICRVVTATAAETALITSSAALTAESPAAGRDPFSFSLHLSLFPSLSLSQPLSFSVSRSRRRSAVTRLRTAPAMLTEPALWSRFDQYALADAHHGRFEKRESGRSSWSDVSQ